MSREAVARERLRDLRSALADRRDLRDVFLALFPEGLTFTPARTPDGARQVWRISGNAHLGSAIAKVGPEHVATGLAHRRAKNEERANVSARKARDGMISPEQVATPTGFEGDKPSDPARASTEHRPSATDDRGQERTEAVARLATALAQAVVDGDHERARQLADELRQLEGAAEVAPARALRLLP